MCAQPHQEGEFMRAPIRTLVFGLLSVLPGLAVAADPPILSDVSIRLFEQADAAVIPVARRVYATHFDATRTRMLGLEISATYAKPESAVEVPITCSMQRPDGSLAASDRPMTFQLFADYTESKSANLLWGIATEEDWQPGNYQVECQIDGKVIGQARFEIMLNPSDVANAEIRVAALQIYPVDRQLPARTDRKYVNTLVGAETRRIGVELEFTHAPLGRALVIPAECYIFWPDGQTSLPVMLSYEPQAAWPGGYSAGALGWDEPGNWLQGVYTVVCMIYGHPVAVDRFVVE